MMKQLRVYGNEGNGYVIQELVLWSWLDITIRFKTYDEAVERFDEISTQHIQEEADA